MNFKNVSAWINLVCVIVLLALNKFMPNNFTHNLVYLAVICGMAYAAYKSNFNKKTKVFCISLYLLTFMIIIFV